jgi:hypothetical protein
MACVSTAAGHGFSTDIDARAERPPPPVAGMAHSPPRSGSMFARMRQADQQMAGHLEEPSASDAIPDSLRALMLDGQ